MAVSSSTTTMPNENLSSKIQRFQTDSNENDRRLPSNIVRFIFENNKKVDIETLDFMEQDKEELMDILGWLEKSHEQNKLSISELISFQKIAMMVPTLVFWESYVLAEKRKFYRILYPSKEPEWAAVNESTIKKVPFLDAATSSRWQQNDDEDSPVTLTSVRATSLNLLDIFLEDKNETIETDNILLTMFTCSSDKNIFEVNPKEIYEDFDYMGVLVEDKFKVENCEDFNVAEACKQYLQIDDVCSDCDEDIDDKFSERLRKEMRKEIAIKLMLAIHLDQFNCKDLDTKTLYLFHQVFFRQFVYYDFRDIDKIVYLSNSKEFLNKLNFTEKQLNRLSINKFLSNGEVYFDCIVNRYKNKYDTPNHLDYNYYINDVRREVCGKYSMKKINKKNTFARKKDFVEI